MDANGIWWNMMQMDSVRLALDLKFGNSDSEESSEYKDCEEELSDVQ